MRKLSYLATTSASLIWAWGCGSENHVECLDESRPHRISVSSSDVLTSVWLKTSDREWERLDAEELPVEVCVSRAYAIATACDSQQDYAFEYLKMYEDGPNVALHGCGETTDPSTQVQATIAQPAFVTVEGFGVLSTSGPWSFVADVTNGEHVLIASDSDWNLASVRTNRAVVRRFQAPTPPLDVDLDTDGVNLIDTPLNIMGLDSAGTIMSSTRLLTDTGEDLVVSSNVGTATYAIPQSSLEQSESQVFHLEQYVNEAEFSYSRSGTSAASTFSLLPRFAGVSLERGVPSRASWSELLPTATEFTLRETPLDGAVGIREIRASRNWLESAGAIQLDFDMTLPALRDTEHFVGGPTFSGSLEASVVQLTTAIWLPPP